MAVKHVAHYRGLRPFPDYPQCTTSRHFGRRSVSTKAQSSYCYANMPTTCAVVKCHNRSGRDKVSFYRIPVVIKGQGEATERKSERCRRLWLAAINRADVDEKTCNKLRVCSDHFISGARNKYDETNPDWVPNKNLGYDVKSPTKSAIRHERLQNRKQTIKMNEAAISLLELSASVSEPPCAEEVDGVDSTEATDTELTDAEMLEFANERISELEFENARLKEQNECLQNIVHKMKANLPEDFEDDNDKVKYYTGLPSFTILMALFNLLAPDMHENGNSSLNKFQKIILTLMRLRLNLPITDLSYRFGVSRTTVSKVFLDTLHLMHDIMGPLVRWPDRDELYETMPMVFRKHFGKQVTCIIDCFEIFIDRPSNLTARAQTWSSYKHHNTAKYLIAITPQGSVSYISKGWGGRTSDKFLTAHSNFLDNLSHGDVILADRGFDIKELVALVGAEVKYPAFMRRKKQMCGPEVEGTRKIANVRIHVERVIGTVRQKFMILGATIPIDYLISKPEEEYVILDKIVTVCCSLICAPLLYHSTNHQRFACRSSLL